MRVVSPFYAWYVFVRSRCHHRRIPRSVVAVVLAPSVIVSSATDPPHPPSPRSSPTIGASGEPWTTTTTAFPHRASRTSTMSRRLLCARRPCSSPSSSLSSSSSRNAPPKVGGGRPPRNRARSSPRSHIGVVVILRCNATAIVTLPILPPMNNVPMLIAGIDAVAVFARFHRRRAAAPLSWRSSGGGSRPPGGGGSRPGGVGGQRRRIRHTPPPPSPSPSPSPLLPLQSPLRYRRES